MRGVYAAVIVIAAVAAAFVLHSRLTAVQSKWEAHVEAAQTFAQKEAARADSLVAVADSVEAVAAESARLAFERGRRLRERVVEVREVVVPDTCAPFIAARDTIIDGLLAVTDSLETAYTEQVSVADNLRIANSLLSASIDTLHAVINARPRPGRFSVVIGPSLGYCTNGPCMGVSLTFGIKVR